MRPSSTVMLPGPTCFQPARSLPLNRGFHSFDCGRAARARPHIPTQAPIAASLRNMHPPRNRRESELQVAQIVVTDFDVVESGLRVVVFDEIVLDAGSAVVREKILPVDGALANVGHMAAILDRLAHGALVAAIGTGVFHPVFDVNARETP